MKFLFLFLFPVLSFAFETKDLISSLEENKSILIDVREKDEIIHGMIKQAKWYALSQTSQDTLSVLKKEIGSKEVYVYCRSGARAEKFITKLKSLGIKATNLGGFETLVKKGLAVKR